MTEKEKVIRNNEAMDIIVEGRLKTINGEEIVFGLTDDSQYLIGIKEEDGYVATKKPLVNVYPELIAEWEIEQSEEVLDKILKVCSYESLWVTLFLLIRVKKIDAQKFKNLAIKNTQWDMIASKIAPLIF